MSGVICNECLGSGEVIWTKERGGPKCNGCNGHGFIPYEMVQYRIAALLDHPSVYMGGPSHGNMRRAEKIMDLLMQDGLLNVPPPGTPPVDRPKEQ